MKKYYRFFLQLIGIPEIFYVIAVLIFVVVFLLCKNLRWGKRISIAATISYMFVVLAITVLNRKVGSDFQYSITPFWSYEAIAIGGVKGITLQKSVLFNLLMLVPVGMTLPVAIDKKKWRTILIGFAFSCTVEFLQLITKGGLFEIDDIIHNTIGCAVGFGVYKLVCALKRGWKKDN